MTNRYPGGKIRRKTRRRAGRYDRKGGEFWIGVEGIREIVED